MKRWMQHPIILLIFVAMGALWAYQLGQHKQAPEARPNVVTPRYVQIQEVQRQPYRSQVTGYGFIEPSIILPIKAEVSGKVEYLHPNLQQGVAIGANERVILIDPQDYEVSLKQTEAELASSQYSLEQLEEQLKSTRRSLDLSQKNRDVGRQELTRLKDLQKKGLVAQSQVDGEKQRMLQLEQQVSELQGQLQTQLSSTRVERARIERYQQGVKGQQQTLGRTEISMPFSAKIGQVNVELGEYVNAGTTLFEAHDIRGVEINTEVSTIQMYHLVSHLGGIELSESQLMNHHDLTELLGLEVEVRLTGVVPSQTRWQARVLRISNAIDPIRRTLSIVVGIENPYDKIIPGERPPLMKGMHAAVEFTAPEREVIVIPRRALHEGRVYLVTPQNQLKIQPVAVAMMQGDQVVIKSGLSAGDRLIVSDVVPVIEGMLVRPYDPAEQQP